MADVKTPEYTIPVVTDITDNDLVRIVLENNTSRNIKKKDLIKSLEEYVGRYILDGDQKSINSGDTTLDTLHTASLTNASNTELVSTSGIKFNIAGKYKIVLTVAAKLSLTNDFTILANNVNILELISKLNTNNINVNYLNFAANASYSDDTNIYSQANFTVSSIITVALNDVLSFSTALFNHLLLGSTNSAYVDFTNTSIDIYKVK